DFLIPFAINKQGSRLNKGIAWSDYEIYWGMLDLGWYQSIEILPANGVKRTLFEGDTALVDFMMLNSEDQVLCRQYGEYWQYVYGLYLKEQDYRFIPITPQIVNFNARMQSVKGAMLW